MNNGDLVDQLVRERFALPAKLDDREAAILQYLAEGLTYQQIAERTHYTSGAVRKKAWTLFRKLGARNGPHAVHLGWLYGLLRAEA